jgi:hypothetical protein
MKYILMMLWFPLLATADPDSVRIKVFFTYKDKMLVLGKTYQTPLGEIFTLTDFKLYLSNFTFEKASGEALKSSGAFLVDLADTSTHEFNLEVTAGPFARVTFDLGIDQKTSTSGAHAGALDPMHGMYWSWQSGYINFKLEGTSPQSTARKNKVEFHVGGYQQPYYALRTITGSGTNIVIDLQEFFSQLNIEKNHTVVSPGHNAMYVADAMQKAISTR